jgi:hypothetical protein
MGSVQYRIMVTLPLAGTKPDSLLKMTEPWHNIDLWRLFAGAR